MAARKDSSPIPQNPLLLRFHRLMEAFAQSDDENDFYLDVQEGFLLYIDLDKGMEEVERVEAELEEAAARYCLVPKLTFYEMKKMMEGFVNEKVYDIDTKEKLLEIIQSKEAREHFFEFLYDHDAEFEKWQQYYQERFRVRIIEWLRQREIQFVFEEDLDLPRPMLEKLKTHLFDTKVSKEVIQGRQALVVKAKTYYSNEALNPRPKRGRPPKQVAKVETEMQLAPDMYTTVPVAARQFLFLPEHGQGGNFAFAKRGGREEAGPSLRSLQRLASESKLGVLSQKFASLRDLSQRLATFEDVPELPKIDFTTLEEDEEEEDEEPVKRPAAKPLPKKAPPLKKKRR